MAARRKLLRTGFCKICYRGGPGVSVRENGWCDGCWSAYVSILCKIHGGAPACEFCAAYNVDGAIAHAPCCPTFDLRSH